MYDISVQLSTDHLCRVPDPMTERTAGVKKSVWGEHFEGKEYCKMSEGEGEGDGYGDLRSMALTASDDPANNLKYYLILDLASSSCSKRH